MALPAIIAGVVGLSPIVLPLARRILFGLGFGLVTYVGVKASFDALEAQVYASLGGASANVLMLLGMADVDVAIKTVLTACGVKLGFMGLNAAGSLVRPRWKWND